MFTVGDIVRRCCPLPPLRRLPLRLLMVAVSVSLPVTTATQLTAGAPSNQYSYIRGVSSHSALCPGFYCGRIALADGNYSECGACPRGYRLFSQSTCHRCDASPTVHDWLYLAFMALLYVTLHWRAIDAHAQCCFGSASVDGPVPGVMVRQFVSALVETAVAAVVTLLLLEPVGQLAVRSCTAYSLADWYTVLYNPSPNYDHTLSCTQEAVYPLYSGVLLFYALALGVMLLLRPLVMRGGANSSSCGAKCRRGSGSGGCCDSAAAACDQRQCHSTAGDVAAAGATGGGGGGGGGGGTCEGGPMYSALLFTPALMAVHAVFAGMIYYSFGYLTVIASTASSALLLATYPEQRPCMLWLIVRRRSRRCLALLMHWLAHFLGALALGWHVQPVWCLAVQQATATVAPTLFYVFTVHYTAPSALVAPTQAGFDQVDTGVARADRTQLADTQRSRAHERVRFEL